MSTTAVNRAQTVLEWRREFAEMVLEIRQEGLHEGICKQQVLELAAIRCDWGSLACFREHCEKPR